MQPFRAFIEKYQKLSEPEWEEIKSCLMQKTYPKGELILESGKICSKLYFIEKGFLRYYLWKDGNDVTKFFTEAPYCFTSQRSFTNNIPAQENIVATTEAVIWEMNKTDAFQLLKYQNWSEFIRKLIQEVQFFTEQILEEIQNHTAEERYIKMLEENNPILTQAALKDIASYLGIAPQSLSRIRKKYWSKKQKLT